MRPPVSSAAVGVALAGLLGLPPLRAALESAMVTHMLLQIPLLALAGWILAGSLPAKLDAHLDRLDRSGIALALVALFASSYWMLPRALDAALNDPWVELSKFLTLPLLVGVPARLCARRLSPLAAGFIVANLLSMWAAAGWMYREFPARLCNYYLIDDQVLAGTMLVWLSVALALIWLASFFVEAGAGAQKSFGAGAPVCGDWPPSRNGSSEPITVNDGRIRQARWEDAGSGATRTSLHPKR